MVESFYALLEQSTLSLLHFTITLLEQPAPISSLLHFTITLLEQPAPISSLLHFTNTLLEQGEYGLRSFVCLCEHGGSGL